MGVACPPEVLPEVVLGVGGICYEQREDASPSYLDRGDDDQHDACHKTGLWAHLSPSFYEGGTDAPWRGVRSCSTTNSLTCSLPTSSSSMLRCSILPRFTASALIARAPIARAPMAPAPTAKAPNAAAPVAARPIATRPKAACLPEADRFFRITVSFLMILAPCPSSLWSFVPPNPGPKDRRRQSRTRSEREPPSRCPSRSAASKTTIPRPRVRS